MTNYLHGMTGAGGAHLMGDKPGWLLLINEIGRDPANIHGVDFRPYADRGFWVISRLQNGWGSAGTIPLPAYYADYVKRAINFVQASPGCHVWQWGNELNHPQERAEFKPIYPSEYARLYCEMWRRLHDLPGHEEDQLITAPIAPWNNQTAYPANPSGDWIVYFQDVLSHITDEIGTKEGETVDAIGLHAYTHGVSPALITSEQRMDPPFQERRFQFRTYQDFMLAIPEALRRVPVHILEIDQDEPWWDGQNGWSPAAITEIGKGWNQTPGNQQIVSLVWFRWEGDRWHIANKPRLQDDIRAAFALGYTWGQGPPVPSPSVTYRCPGCGREMVVRVKEAG